MNALKKSKMIWEAMARSDPYWAICAEPRKHGGKWHAADLLATGVFEVETVLSFVGRLGLIVRSNGKALDFGCGVGRLTQALSRYFAECYGVDISSEMVTRAIALAKNSPNCRFLVNEAPDLSLFDSNSFSFIYSNLVLHHIESDYVTKYLREFARVLEPGGILVFQIPDHRKGDWIQRMREHLKLRTRLRRLLAFVGVPPGPPRGGWKMYCYGEQKI
jgi:SAM-dependent methyltransferase